VTLTLVPLTRALMHARLDANAFTWPCVLPAGARDVRFGPEWPGDALVLYPGLVAAGAPVNDLTFVIVAVDAREAVGQIGTAGPPDGGEAEIGYGVNRSWRGRGIATAAVGLLLDALAAHPDVTTVTARTAVANPASGRVLEKNGFTPTGRAESAWDGELIVWTHQPDTHARREGCEGERPAGS